MTRNLAARTARYRHDPGWKAQKKFATGSTARSFTVLIASAEDAGIIAPEQNGIAILDNDNLAVVLDRHCISSSGYFGPTAEQKQEFGRIMDMSWETFASFCREHPRFRGEIIRDVSSGARVPDEGNTRSQQMLGLVQPMKGQDIRTSRMREAANDPDCPYRFEAGSRDEMIAFLSRHSVHRDGPYDSFRLSWPIHMNMDYDASGHAEWAGTNPVWHERWDREFETDPAIFNEACERGLAPYFDRSFSTWGANDAGDYEFTTQGRSGGHLVLQRFQGKDLTFTSLADLDEQLNRMEDMSLAAIYRLTVMLDHDLSPENRAKEFEHQLIQIRQRRELEWSLEADGRLAYL